LRVFLLIFLTITLSTNLFGFWGSSSDDSSSSKNIKDKPIEVADDIYEYSKEVVNNILLKEDKSTKDEVLILNLKKMNVIGKESKFNNLAEVFANQIFERISKTNDGFTVLTRELLSDDESKSFILYYTKEREFYKVIIFEDEVGKLVISSDANVVFIEKNRSVMDLNNYKTVQTFTKQELYNSEHIKGSIFYSFRFSKTNKYLYYVKKYKFRNNYTHIPIMKEIISKKQVYGTDFLDVSDKSKKFWVDVSPNEKYILHDYRARDYGKVNQDSLILYPIKSTKAIKTFYDYKGGVPVKEIAWNKDMLFYTYLEKNNGMLKMQNGIYDITKDTTYCKNLLDKPIHHIVWNENDDFIYLIGNNSVFPYLFKDKKCTKMKVYSHNLDLKFKSGEKNNIFINGDEKLTVYTKDRAGDKSKLLYIELKKYSDKYLNRLKEIEQVQLMLNSGFEKRGLKLIDKLVDKNYNTDWTIDFKTKKYLYAYKAYIFANIFNQQYRELSKIDFEFSYNYTKLIKYFAWYGYEKEILEINKRFKKSIKIKEVPDEDAKVELAIGESVYLFGIGKDEEAYDKLFSVQPLSNYHKSYVKGLTYCSSAFTKNLDKLAVATGISRDKFSKPVDCHKNLNGEHPFFFDIDGNKVFKDKVKNKEIKKQKKKIKKVEAIELLD
jgi:hypothetical protein